MTDNRNTILAVILSGLVLIAWQYFYNVPQMEKQRQEAQKQAELQKPSQDITAHRSSSWPEANPGASIGLNLRNSYAPGVGALGPAHLMVSRTQIIDRLT